MTPTQDEINGKIAFNGDHFIEKEISKLIKAYQIAYVIETGTYFGGTTRALSNILDNGIVHSIEICKDFYNQSNENLADLIFQNKIHLYNGSSPDVLERILPIIRGPVLFYLDAHWGPYWPIIDELTNIASIRTSEMNIIVIHDFFVPDSNGDAKFGYDEYYKIPFANNLGKISESSLNFLYRCAEKFESITGLSIFTKQKLNEDYIAFHLKLIYPQGYHISFNKHATIANRGIAYIIPLIYSN
jgi:hypothetical protein